MDCPLLMGVSSKAWPLINATSGPHVPSSCCCSSVENCTMSLKDCLLDPFCYCFIFKMCKCFVIKNTSVN